MKTILLILIFISSNIYAAQTCEDYILDKTPNSRYSVKDGTVTDNTTKLMWKQCSEGLSGADCNTGTLKTMNWQSALALGGSSFAGYSDWRLPNIKELGSIVAYNCVSLSINKNVFPNTPAYWFWSSSPNHDGHDTRLLNFDFGYDYGSFFGYDITKYRNKDGYHVRLVRFGQ
jgi:hypothetical protein